MKKLSNLEKLLKEIDNVEQLGADMRYKVNNMFTDGEWHNQKSFKNIDDAVDYIEELIESVFGE